MLRASDLAFTRSNTARTFDTTCEVVSTQEVPDGAGGYTTTETTTQYPCRIAPAANPRDAIAGTNDVAQVVSMWSVSLPVDAAVPPDSSIRVSGMELRAIGSDSGKSQQTVQRVLARRVQ